MNVHVIQHASFEGAGSIVDWCVAGGHELTVTPIYTAGARLPEMEAIHLLVIMGGPMNVYEEEEYPWLVEEKRFIRDFMRLGKPILGICLGAQLLALCCGAKVGRAGHEEIGWYPVSPTPAARAYPWLYALLERQPVLFHWHGDRMDIPEGAENLATTAANDNQAFVLDGGRMIGLQFHPEMTPVLLEQMVSEGRHALCAAGFVQSAETIVRGAAYRDAGSVMRAALDQLSNY